MTGKILKLQSYIVPFLFNDFLKKYYTKILKISFVIFFILLCPFLVILTLYSFDFFGEAKQFSLLRNILFADLIYILTLSGLVFLRVTRLIIARRSQSAGSRLHVRLTTVFIFMALFPTIIVAIFGTISVNFGLESWFSDRVHHVVNSSMESAQAYKFEHRKSITNDALDLASLLNFQKKIQPTIAPGNIRTLLSKNQPSSLKETFIVDFRGNLRLRGERSYLFDFEKISEENLIDTIEGGVTIVEDWENNEFRALVKLEAFSNRILYVTRKVDGSILSLLDQTQDTVILYNQIDKERSQLLFRFGLIYLAFSLLVILLAIWLALWFAERLSKPVGRLAGAAQSVGAGDFEIRVPDIKGDDEIAILGRIFNRMIKQLKMQRDTLLKNTSEIESRKILFETVVGSVTSGIIGLDKKGKIELMNPAAKKILSLDLPENKDIFLYDAIPEFNDLFQKAIERPYEEHQQQIKIIRNNITEELLISIKFRESNDESLKGYVLTFDDLTDLVNAQRNAAWGDVAKRIAHEIKNPLTPIQLSAEKLKRKFSSLVGEEKQSLEEYSDMIIRQTNGLRRMVDEFSEFARMPKPKKEKVNINEIISDLVLLNSNLKTKIDFDIKFDKDKIYTFLDRELISQAINNLIKNASEAIFAKGINRSNFSGKIVIMSSYDKENLNITILDNGVGLPENQKRLFEPYVTSRENGIGLGLAIVKKIVEEHNGFINIENFNGKNEFNFSGTQVKIKLPILYSKD